MLQIFQEASLLLMAFGPHAIRKKKKRSSESLFPASCLLTFPFQPCLLREGWIPPAQTIRSCQLSFVFVKLCFLLASPFGKATQAVSSTAAETHGCRLKKKKKKAALLARVQRPRLWRVVDRENNTKKEIKRDMILEGWSGVPLSTTAARRSNSLCGVDPPADWTPLS